MSVSGKRCVSSAAHANAESGRAHTITVGPDPETVAPSAPSGNCSRTAAKAGAWGARYGSCSRSSAAAANSSADPDAIAAPSSVARATLNEPVNTIAGYTA